MLKHGERSVNPEGNAHAAHVSCHTAIQHWNIWTLCGAFPDDWLRLYPQLQACVISSM